MPDRPPRRVRVRGDLFHGKVPEGAVYVGRAAPGLPASIYANPFKKGEPIERDSELWAYVLALFPGADGPVIGSIGFSSVTIPTAEAAVDAYSRYFFDLPHLLLNAEEQLGGKDLACWCRLPKPGEPDHCHAAWLLGMVAELVTG
jgi:hypothetical protein